MKSILKILTIVLTLSFTNSFGQSNSDSLELKTFWNTQITYLINKDTSGLSETIDFPVSGLWPMFFGLGEPDKKWKKKELYQILDKLLPDDLTNQLSNKSYKDIEMHNYYGFTELLVSYDRAVVDTETGMISEGSLVFFYKKVSDIWKLWSISIAGG